jgi:hypothetical protein
VEGLVAAAARAEERRWVDTEAEEGELLAALAEGVWQELLEDAADALLELDGAAA